MATSREQATKPPTEGDGFGQRAGPEIDLAGVDAKVLVGAAAGSSENAGGMRLIDQKEAAKLFFDGDEFGQTADVAVHREDAVGDDEGAVGGLTTTDLFAQAFGVVVAEPLDLHAGHAAGIEQAAVTEVIDDDAVGGSEESGNEAQVGHVAGAIGESGFGALKGGDVPLHLVVDVESASQQARAAGAGAVAMDGGGSGFVDLGVADESQVIVGGHHEHVMSVGLNARACLGLERHVEGVGVHGAGHRGALEDSAGASVEQIVLLEAPFTARREITLKHVPGGGGETFHIPLKFSV